MGTTKLDLSLRLRHPEADLSPIAQRLGLTPSWRWTKDDPRSTPLNPELEGSRSASYCSIPLPIEQATDMDAALTDALKVISPAEQELKALVNSGGTASMAIGWFCDGDAGARISDTIVARMARLKLTVDVYLYFSPPAT